MLRVGEDVGCGKAKALQPEWGQKQTWMEHAHMSHIPPRKGIAYHRWVNGEPLVTPCGKTRMSRNSSMQCMIVESPVHSRVKRDMKKSLFILGNIG